MYYEVIYSEEVQEKIKQFENILQEYEDGLWIYLKKKYSDLYKTYPAAASSHVQEDFNKDRGRIAIKYQIQKIKDLSIPEGFYYKFED